MIFIEINRYSQAFLFFVVIKSFSGFSSEFILSDEVFECFDWGEEGLIWVRFVPPLKNKFVRVKTYIVGEFKGTHRVTSSQFHRDICKRLLAHFENITINLKFFQLFGFFLISRFWYLIFFINKKFHINFHYENRLTDILFWSMTSLNQSDGFHEVGHEKSVDDKTGSIDTINGSFSHSFTPV